MCDQYSLEIYTYIDYGSIKIKKYELTGLLKEYATKFGENGLPKQNLDITF